MKCKAIIEAQLAYIGLELNEKTTIYPIKQGVKILQWRLFYTETGKVVMRMSSKKMGKQRRRLRKILIKEISGEYFKGTGHTSLVSWRANAERWDCWYRQIRMRNYFYNEKARILNVYSARKVA